MFITAKLLAFATQPLAWVAVLLALGLLLLRRQASDKESQGSGLIVMGLLILLLQGWEPLPDALLRQLETQQTGPSQEDSLKKYTGVIVLGGALEPAYVWQGHYQPALNDAAERMTTPVTLLRQFPHLQMLFTGGEGELFAHGLSEAERAKIYFDSMGVPTQRVIYESKSHTTFENATLSAQLPGIKPEQPWLLLTSANHMPRAMATFKKAGWNVTPYPVDYQTGTQTPWTQYSMAVGSRKWKMALHEVFGLWAYQLAGRA
jgi:uncharacterized SAM-binding protein YcdF (DUF218 family)